VTAEAPRRDLGIDVARGLAVLLMFQTHAYDAYVAAPHRASLAYRVTRELGASPAPSFLLLAGVGVALGELAMRRAGASSAVIRGRFVRRGLEVAATGYVVSLAYALIDRSFAPETLLRADILHAIGLGIAVVAALLVGRSGKAGVAAALALVTVALALPIALGDTLQRALPAGAGWAGAAVRAPLALLVDVPGYSRFPLLPLVGFTALGVLVGRGLALLPAPARAGQALAALVGCVAGAAGLSVATRACVAALPLGPLTRAHPAVALNLADGALRAGAVLALGLLLAAWLSGRVLAPLVRLGRGSLLAYGLHIPGCYGALARPLARRFDLLGASAVLAVLALATYLAVWARDAVRDWLRGRRARAMPAR
jgi:uncharacterized membrane protein